MEEWLQTEWPQLQVALTSVTDHGPRSRDVIGAVCGDLDVSNEAFPFMTWRDTSLDGVPLRVARVSFSGELAFEVNVNVWHAPAVWERLLAAGRAYGITPRHRDHACVARRERLPDHRAGHRRHRHPARSACRGRCRRRSQTSSVSAVEPGRESESVAQAARRAVAGRQGHPTAGGLADRRVLHGRCACAVTGSHAGPRRVELPQRRARSHLCARSGQGGPFPDR
ncbi:MAG: sarcosine oxidase, subunit alpha [Mycobacterium sp.]|nr:sarcosine oxidase, subunit alpha [Mycobacterium sp.]